MKIVQLKTGLFPDAARVEEAVETLRSAQDVTDIDLTGLAQSDAAAWTDVARKLLAAELVVTL